VKGVSFSHLDVGSRFKKRPSSTSILWA